MDEPVRNGSVRPDAPFGSTGSARFAGGHVRGKVRLGGLAALPLQIAVAAEYAFNRPVFDDELQTLELRPIVAYVRGRLMLLANPSVELVTWGRILRSRLTAGARSGLRVQPNASPPGRPLLHPR